MSDDLREAVARAISAFRMGLVLDPDGKKLPDEMWRQSLGHAEAAIRVVVEACAEVADEHAIAWGRSMGTPAVVIAAAIRKLGEHNV